MNITYPLRLGVIVFLAITGVHSQPFLQGDDSSQSRSSDSIQIHDLRSLAVSGNCLSGVIAADSRLDSTDGPISICGNITIGSGVTMVIDPGTTLQFAQGVGLTVASGGRLVAEGNESNRIHFTRSPSATAWGGFTVNGSVGSPETRISFADFAGNGATAVHSAGGTVLLDHLNFLAADHPYISLDGSSFVVSDCTFPASTKKIEVAHGTGGIKSGGHGVFTRDFFGGTIGYSDAIDFTGGNRPAPIVHFIDNVFAGSQDDGIDVDGTDAWIEGNIFLHVHRNGDTPDTASGVSGGSNSGKTSEVTIMGNLFFDCDNATTAKQGNFFTLLDNTIVHMTKTGGIDGASGAVCVRDTTPSPTTFARGLYLENNVIWDVIQLVRNYDPAQTTVTLNSNTVPFAWSGPGVGNVIAQPLFVHLPTVAETHFTNWLDAQVLWTWLKLLPSSPGSGTGWEGNDQGGHTPSGVRLNAQVIRTNENSARINVGYDRTGSGIPIAGWPQGAGYTHYNWRLDGGAWNGPVTIGSPIELSNLPPGQHYVEVSGQRDSGLFQDNPLFGADAVLTRSATWEVSGTLEILEITRANGITELTFSVSSPGTYTVQYKDSLSDVSWTDLQDVITPSGGILSATDSGTANDRFYRVVLKG